MIPFVNYLNYSRIFSTFTFRFKNSVYEKLFETSDIMSDAFELCVGHFHYLLDIFLFDIKTLDSAIKNGHIFAKIWDILTYPDFWPPWDT